MVMYFVFRALIFSYCKQGPSGSDVMTSEQVMSDITNAPDNDVVFVTQPPGAVGNTSDAG